MTEQDVFDMAREVCGKWPRFMSNPNLQAFAKLVAEKEREACAKLCEEQMQGKSIWIEGARACSLVIRARGQA